jgi:hypothetical protein
MLSKSLTKHFKSSSGDFSELHAEFVADTVLDLAIDRKKNLNKKSKNHSSTYKAYTQRGKWQIDAIGLWKYDLGLPSHFTEIVTTRTLKEFSDTTSYRQATTEQRRYATSF